MNWLCPACEAKNIGCSICDGGNFITDAEMHMYLKNNTIKIMGISKPPKPPVQQTLELDLNEFLPKGTFK